MVRIFFCDNISKYRKESSFLKYVHIYEREKTMKHKYEFLCYIVNINANSVHFCEVLQAPWP